jgi:TPP-dependent pyruvate/acetoin dehydrogenase alpha subunit
MTPWGARLGNASKLEDTVLEQMRTAANSRTEMNDEIGAATRLALYRSQFAIRSVEKRAYDLFLQNLVKGTSHLAIGQEAVAAGFAMSMKPEDWSFCTYRGHAHTLARGASMTGVLGELMGRECGLMGGKGGSMHLTDIDNGVMGSYAIVGAHLPIAMGAAWSAQYRGTDQVAVCFFGDGTTNIGAFHEALSMASIWKLPVVFVCENNLYMEYTPIAAVTPVKNPAADRASAYGLDRILIDGNDVDVVYRTAQSAIARARAGAGPSLIEALTYRHHGHSRADPAKYRPTEEVDAWMKRDPIPLYRQRLIEFGVAESMILAMEEEIKQAVDQATDAAKSSPPPADELIYKDVWANGGWAWRN